MNLTVNMSFMINVCRCRRFSVIFIYLYYFFSHVLRLTFGGVIFRSRSNVEVCRCKVFLVKILPKFGHPDLVKWTSLIKISRDIRIFGIQKFLLFRLWHFRLILHWSRSFECCFQSRCRWYDVFENRCPISCLGSIN